MNFLGLFYPYIVFMEEGWYCTIYSDYLDDIDNFILSLNKLTNYPIDENIILNITSSLNNLSIQYQLNDDLISLVNQFLTNSL